MSKTTGEAKVPKQFEYAVISIVLLFAILLVRALPIDNLAVGVLVSAVIGIAAAIVIQAVVSRLRR